MCAEGRRAPFAFVLTTGDNFYLPDGVATAANYRRPERCLRAAGVRWRAAWGNHDAAGGGHNHAYERLEAGGVTYITTGGGGAPLSPCVRPSREPRRCVAAHHFLAVTASARAVAVRAVLPSGATLERVRIPVV